MNKAKKESGSDCNAPNLLKRTIANPPCRSEDHDQFSRASHSRSTDSSPERNLPKYGKPMARGSETDIIFDKSKLKKYKVTVKNNLAIAPALHIKNPETITPIRRPDEGRRPLFGNIEKKEKSSSPDDHKSSHVTKHLESNKRRHRSKSREESPDYRSRRSRSEHSGSRKHRRAHTPPSRRSYSSDSNSSSDERRRRPYPSGSNRERYERCRKDYERKKALQHRERRLHSSRYPNERPRSDGNISPPYRLKRRSEETSDGSNDEPQQSHMDANPMNVVMAAHPVRMPPPYMMRLPMSSFPPYPMLYLPPMRFRPRPCVPPRPVMGRMPMLRPGLPLPGPQRGNFRPP